MSWKSKGDSSRVVTARDAENRAFGVAHGVTNCGICAEYATCAKIQGFLQMVPQARAVLAESAASKA